MAVTVSFSLSGGVSEDSAKIVGRVSGATSTLKIEYADNNSFTDSTTTPLLSVDTDFLTKASLENLSIDTQYYYRYIDGIDVIADVFKFKTTAIESPYSFTMGFGGCPRATVDSVVFGRIRDRNVEFFQSLGDTTYIDNEDPTGVTQKNAWFTWLARSDVREMNDNIAYSYMWDDHDFGNNDSNSLNPATSAQQANFRNMFPSHDLELASGSIYYAYTVGRVRFIVPDLRSERLDPLIVSETQMAWIKQEFTDYSENDNLKAVVLVSSSMWLPLFDNDAPDSWQQAAAQRTELTDHIVLLGVNNEMVLISSDIHVLCGDSGANNNYGTGGTGGWPVYHSAPMAGTTYGTPTTNIDLGYASPSHGGGSVFQYATLEIVDNITSVDITYNGYNAVADTKVITHSINIAPPEPVIPPTPVDYTYGFTYTLPTITGTLTDFPILMTSGSFPANAIDGGDTTLMEGGGNLRAYTDNTKTKRLPLEVVSFEVGATPNVEVYVKIPTASTASTIYIEGDDTDVEQPPVDSPYGSQAVWAQYELVTHNFTSDSSGNHILTNAGVTQGVNSPPTGGVSGNFGTGSEYKYLSTDIPSLSDYTLSCWAYPTSVNTAGLDCILMQNPSAVTINQSSLLFDSEPDDIGLFNTPDGWLRSGKGALLNTWQYVSVSNDASNRDIYIDGSVEAASSGSLESTDRTLLRVGARNPQGSTWLYAGEMAEIRVRKESVSTGFKDAEYGNQSDSDNWGSVGVWESQESSSTLNMADTNTPDGTYSADIYNNDTKTLIETRDITFSGGNASETIPLGTGTKALVFIEGANPPVTGLAYLGVTE
jgi:hypothetical protein